MDEFLFRGEVRAWRLSRVIQEVGLKRSAIYKAMSEGKFPKNFPLIEGGRAKAWLAQDVISWISSRHVAADGDRRGTADADKECGRGRRAITVERTRHGGARESPQDIANGERPPRTAQKSGKTPTQAEVAKGWSWVDFGCSLPRVPITFTAAQEALRRDGETDFELAMRTAPWGST